MGNNKTVANIDSKNRGSGLVHKVGHKHAAPDNTHPVGTGQHKARKGYESGPTKGSGMSTQSIKAKVGSKKRGSSLISEHGFGHESQGDGHGIGTGQHAAKIRGMPHGGDRHTFHPPAANGAHGFGHGAHLRRGPLRLSGASNAHRIGARKK